VARGDSAADCEAPERSGRAVRSGARGRWSRRGIVPHRMRSTPARPPTRAGVAKSASWSPAREQTPPPKQCVGHGSSFALRVPV